MQKNYRSQPTKASLKAIRGGNRQALALRQTGVKPDATTPAGIYKVSCEAARPTTKWGRPVIECSFRVVDGDHFGTALAGWLAFKPVGDGGVEPCEYTETCARLLGREEPGDDIHWETVLVGKLLDVEARYRLTNAKSRIREDPTKCKDATDFLRVSRIIGYTEL